MTSRYFRGKLVIHCPARAMPGFDIDINSEIFTQSSLECQSRLTDISNVATARVKVSLARALGKQS